METSNSPSCTSCGGTLRGAFVGGVCPRCLLARMSSPEPAPDFSDSREAALADGPASGAEAWRVGMRLGDYELLDVLGSGGMAVVYLARQISLDRLVALKTMAAPLAADSQSQERFRRESRAVAQLDHPGIVSIYDAGLLCGALFYTMDYVEGPDLGRVLRERTLPVRQSALIIRRVAEAVGYAHARGIVHRDLKPANVLLDAQGEPRVADFGLVLEAGGQPGGSTLTGDLLGTPPYMAPEILASGAKRATPPSDVYALGAMLFQMLTGRTPFIGDSPSEILHLALTGQPPPPRLLNPAVPRDLETICLKCLEKEPSGRYHDAAALGEDLARFLNGEPIIAKAVTPVGRFTRWCRRKPAFAAVWFLLTALAVGSTAATIWIQRERFRAEGALEQTRAAETQARERLREAKLAEARAISHTTIPGRRGHALSALKEAAQIRPGADLRDEALAALLLFDARLVESWDFAGGPVEVSVDPQGSTAAAEARNETDLSREPARFWQWGSKQPFATLSTAGARALGPIRFSTDGKLIMARFVDETLRVWRVGEPQPFLTLAHRRPPYADRSETFNQDYDFTPDGASLVLGLPNGVSLHRVADGAETARWENAELVDQAVVSPDGRLLAVANQDPERKAHSTYVLTLPDLKLIRTFPPTGANELLAWSADSRVLAIGQEEGDVASYDVRDGRLLPRVSVNRGPRDLRFLGHDALLATRNMTSLHVMNVALGREELTFNGVGTSDLAVRSNGDSFVFSSLAGGLSRMAVETPLGFRVIPPALAKGNEIIGNTYTLDFSADGHWIALSSGNLLLILDPETGRLAGSSNTGIAGRNDRSSVAFAADGRALYRCSTLQPLSRYSLVADQNGSWQIGPAEPLDIEAGFFIADQTADRQRLVLLNFTSGAVKIVSVVDGKLLTLSRWIAPGIYNAAFSPDGSQLLTNCTGQGESAGSQRVRVYRVADGKVIRELPGSVCCDASWSTAGHVALTSNDRESIAWDTTDWHVQAVLKGDLGGYLTTYAVSPDGGYAVVACDNRVHFVSLVDGAVLASFESPAASGFAASVRFFPDGKRVAILWRDARLDIIDPVALRRGLAELGLDW